MFRQLILSAVLTTATLTGLALTPAAADARPPVEYHRHDRHGRFEVFYLECGRWENYGGYRDRDDAERAAHQLRHRGYAVKIERC